MTARVRRPCLVCGALTRSSYCARHNPKDAVHARTHVVERARWADTVATGTVSCSRCGERIARGQAWDIDRRPWGYRPSHAHCNRSAGGRHEP